MQRGIIFVVSSIHVRALGQQQLRHLAFAFSRGLMQRRVSLSIPGLDISPLGDEQADCFFMTLLRSQIQGHLPAIVLG